MAANLNPDTTAMDQEPSITIGVISTVVASALTMAVAFGAPITQEQQTAILGFVAAVGPLITALFIRRRVYAPQTVRRMVSNAAKGGPLA